MKKKPKYKIKIKKISKEIFSWKGFDRRGCYGHTCDDACCRDGCDVDKESYVLIWAHRRLIEKSTCIPLEECFEEDWSGDPEFLGGNSIESRVGRSGYCVFHLPGEKGCVLYRLADSKKAPRGIIPSICRLYPLTWGYGSLFITDDLKPTCNCLAGDNRSRRTIFQTQKREIDDIFDIDSSLLP